MVIGGIVMIDSLAHQPNQKVSIHSFVMMQRHQVEVIQTKKGRDS